MNTRELGKSYEELACTYLINKNYSILATNYQKRSGEIDIIAQKNNLVSFVEVKYRKTNSFYNPREAVTFSKQQKIIKTAEYYIFENFSENNCNYNYTFDIIEIVGKDNLINHIENAFYL